MQAEVKSGIGNARYEKFEYKKKNRQKYVQKAQESGCEERQQSKTRMRRRVVLCRTVAEKQYGDSLQLDTQCKEATTNEKTKRLQ